jgi:hypothetical protein
MVSDIVLFDDDYNDNLLTMVKETLNNSDSKFKDLKSRKRLNIVIYNLV